jgi:hypothetical protein
MGESNVYAKAWLAPARTGALQLTEAKTAQCNDLQPSAAPTRHAQTRLRMVTPKTRMGSFSEGRKAGNRRRAHLMTIKRKRAATWLRREAGIDNWSCGRR